MFGTVVGTFVAMWAEERESLAAEVRRKPRDGRIERRRENLTRFFQSLLKARLQLCCALLHSPETL